MKCVQPDVLNSELNQNVFLHYVYLYIIINIKKKLLLESK